MINTIKIIRELIGKKALVKTNNKAELFTPYNNEIYKVNDEFKEHFFVQIDKIKFLAKMMSEDKYFDIKSKTSDFSKTEINNIYNNKLQDINNSLIEITNFSENIRSYIKCTDLLEIINNGYGEFLAENKDDIYNYYYNIYLKDCFENELNKKEKRKELICSYIDNELYDDFIKLEGLLIETKFMNKKYEWETQRRATDLSVILSEYKVFLRGKKTNKFITTLYKVKRDNKYRPKFETALANFTKYYKIDKLLSDIDHKTKY